MLEQAHPPSSDKPARLAVPRAGRVPSLGLTRELLIATIFLTRMPLPYRGVPPADALVRSVWAFPIVGLVIGGLSFVVYLLARLVALETPVAALLAVAASVLLTGALHEDGLGDVADGFGGGGGTEDKLAIMKDSRIGTYGVLAIGLVVGVRVFCIASIGRFDLVAAGLVASHILGRAAMPVTMRALWPARPTGLAASAGRPSLFRVSVGLILGLAGALACGSWFAEPIGFPTAAFGLIAPPLLAVAGVGWLARRQIGGYTGDVLGAVEQAGEAATMLAAAALSAHVL